MKKLYILLLTLLFALPCYGQDLARMNVGIVGGGVAGVAACSNATYAPTADYDKGDWTSTLSTLYESIDTWPTDGTNSIYQEETGTQGYDVVRFSLPGNCNVTQVVLWINSSYALTPAQSILASVSQDYSTYETDQSFTTGTVYNGNEDSKTYSVSYTTPAYIYVRFKGVGSTSFNELIYGMKIVVN